MENQLSFEFCSDCGSYLLAEQGKVVIRDGLPVVLCSDCQDKPEPDTVDALVADFERLYGLTPEK